MEICLESYQEAMLALANEISGERGGRIVSVETAGKLTSTFVSVTCSKGHQFRSSMHSIKFGNGGKGTWCPECSKGGAPSLTIGYVRQYLRVRGAKLLSKSYSNNMEYLDVLCPNGHEYRKKFVHIERGQGCPVCIGNPRHKDVTLDHIVSLTEKMRGHGVKPSARKLRGRDIVGIRERLKVSQARFADLIGVAVASLRFWEHDRQPSDEVLELMRLVIKKPDVFYKIATEHERESRRPIVDPKFTERALAAESFARSMVGREMRSHLLRAGWEEIGIRSNGKPTRNQIIAGFRKDDTMVKICADGRPLLYFGYKQVKEYPSWAAFRNELSALPEMRDVFGPRERTKKIFKIPA